MQAQLFDLDILATFIGDDPSLQRSMLQKFTKQMLMALLDIRDLQQNNQASAIGALGHKLKASARTVGARELAEKFERLEKAGKAEEWNAINEAVSQISEIIDRLNHQVEALNS